jgi:hypothetical protein
MRRNRVVRALAIVPLAVAFLGVFGYVVMRLWNWLMPGLFGFHMIGFWQSVGLLVLSKILFGGFHGRHSGRGRMHWRGRMMDRWGKMTPEEREKFRHTIRESWGGFEASSGEPKA